MTFAWVAVTVALSVLLILFTMRRLDDFADKKHGEWRERGTQMRRWRGNQWEYRPLSDSEIEASVREQENRAW